MKLTLRLRIRWAAIAAAALLIAQMGAMAHAYSHAPQAGSVSAHQIPGTHDFCSDCLNFAPLLSAAGAPVVPSLVLPQGCNAAPPPPLPLTVDLKPLLGFRSRAPPVTP
jgi:hypothetical protein